MSAQEVANIKEFVKDKPDLAKEIQFNDKDIVFSKQAMTLLKTMAEQQKDGKTQGPASVPATSGATTSEAPASAATVPDNCKRVAGMIGGVLGAMGVGTNSNIGGAACNAMNKPKAAEQQTPN